MAKNLNWHELPVRPKNGKIFLPLANLYRYILAAMSRLSVALQSCLDRLSMTAAALERAADLPAMSIKSINGGSHPRPERFERLLAALGESPACQAALLVAYILDDVPAPWQDLVCGVLEPALTAWAASVPAVAAVEHASGSARPLSIVGQAREVLQAMGQRVSSGDTVLAEWLADTGALLAVARLGPLDGGAVESSLDELAASIEAASARDSA